MKRAAILIVMMLCTTVAMAGPMWMFNWAGVEAPTDYLHYWNPASLSEDDQADGLDATSPNFNPTTNGWEMGTTDNNYVLCGGYITNGTSYTMTVWIKPDITAMNLNANGGWIVSDRGKATDYDFQLYYTKSTSLFKVAVFDASSAANTDGIGVDGTHDVWTHLAAVVDSTAETLTMYTNAVSDGSSALTITPNDSWRGSGIYTDTTIGASFGTLINPAYKYHGSIGKTRFYNRALSQAELKAEMVADGNTGP